ncbi:hypothetical protein BC833DRAFT_590172 [Globomyces pollinis-pini]|nr:hypothetical protein BC833DRAFT_590172 [Globomyces pollinis-pini]
MTKSSNHIVVVGGGLAGVKVIKSLIQKFHCSGNISITLVEYQNEPLCNIATPRALVDKSFASSCYLSYDKLFRNFSNGKVIHGWVNEMSATSLKVKTNDELLDISFDYLILATGCKVKTPWQHYTEFKDDGLLYLSQFPNTINESQSILLIGGGPTSIETAAEIKETYPQKEVTIVSNGLLSRTDIDPSYIKKLRGKLERLGIVLLLGERIIKPKDFQTDELLVHQHLKTKSGLEIYADLVLDSTGSIKPNTGFVEEFDPTSITESGYIQVTNTLQLEAYKNIFSLGDVANTGAPKMAAVLDPQVSTVTSNIYAMIHQKGLTEYVTPANDTMFLSVGKKDAFGCFKGYNNIVLDYAGIYLKSGDLFLGQLKPLYGL